MTHLSLVKSASLLKEEQRFTEEILLEPLGLGFTRGTIAEIAGGPGSGKTSLLLSLLSRLTRAGEVCAVVDSCSGFDPCSAVSADVKLENLLWVRCGGGLEKAFMAADHLVQAKGFGAVWLNLNGLPKRDLRMVPKTYWYRFRTRIRETPTLVFVTAEEPVTGSAAQQAFTLSRKLAVWKGGGRFKLLDELAIDIHSRKEFYGRPFPAKVGFDHREGK